jgi:hypothetical protein
LTENQGVPSSNLGLGTKVKSVSTNNARDFFVAICVEHSLEELLAPPAQRFRDAVDAFKPALYGWHKGPLAAYHPSAGI